MNLYESIKSNLKEAAIDDEYMKEWRAICEAFCKKIGAELLFVNSDNFGYEDKDGNLVHMYADEMKEFIDNGGLKKESVYGIVSNSVENRLLDKVRTCNSKYDLDDIQIWVTSSGNYNLRTKADERYPEGRDICTVSPDTIIHGEEDEIYLREQGFFDDYNKFLMNESDEGLYVYSNAQSQDGRSDAESFIHNYKAEAPNLDFRVRKDGDMWYVDFVGSKEDIASYLKKLGWYTDKEIEEYGLIKPLNEADDSSNEFEDFQDIKKHTVDELNTFIDTYLKQYPNETGISVAIKNLKSSSNGEYNGWATICIGNHKNKGKVYVFEGKDDGSDDKEMSYDDFCENYEFRLGREGE